MLDLEENLHERQRCLVKRRSKRHAILSWHRREGFLFEEKKASLGKGRGQNLRAGWCRTMSPIIARGQDLDLLQLDIELIGYKRVSLVKSWQGQ